jgi:hypothetical protein
MRLIACLADDSEVSSERSGGETGLCQRHQVDLVFIEQRAGACVG